MLTPMNLSLKMKHVSKMHIRSEFVHALMGTLLIMVISGCKTGSLIGVLSWLLGEIICVFELKLSSFIAWK